MFRRIAFAIVVASLLATIAQVIYYYPKLPDPVVSHFGADGVGNGLMSKANFLIVYFLVQYGMAGLMFGIAWMMPFAPVSTVNIPNKAIWLSEAYRTRFHSLTRSVMGWMAAITALFIALTFELTFQANLSNQKINQVVFWGALTVYLVGVSVVCVAYLIILKQPPQALRQPPQASRE